MRLSSLNAAAFFAKQFIQLVVIVALQIGQHTRGQDIEKDVAKQVDFFVVDRAEAQGVEV